MSAVKKALEDIILRTVVLKDNLTYLEAQQALEESNNNLDMKQRYVLSISPKRIELNDAKAFGAIDENNWSLNGFIKQ